MVVTQLTEHHGRGFESSRPQHLLTVSDFLWERRNYRIEEAGKGQF